jgi:hypothetical protein
MVTAAGRPRATSAAKLGPDSTACAACGRASAITSPISLPVDCSRPLAHITTGLAARQVRCQLPGDGAHMLCRRHHQHHVAGGDVGQHIRGAQAGVEWHARQERCVGVARVDLGDDIGFERPQQRVATGQPRGLGQRRAPRTAADDADTIEGHAEPRRFSLAPLAGRGSGRA